MKKIILFLCFSIVVACSSPKEEPVNSVKEEDVKEVTVYKMISFYEVSEEEPSIFKQSDDINIFIQAVITANKEPGVVDMAEPEYKFNIGKETYFLWIDEKSGTIMNTLDSHTIYSLKKEYAKKLYLLLEKKK